MGKSGREEVGYKLRYCKLFKITIAIIILISIALTHTYTYSYRHTQTNTHTHTHSTTENKLFTANLFWKCKHMCRFLWKKMISLPSPPFSTSLSSSLFLSSPPFYLLLSSSSPPFYLLLFSSPPFSSPLPPSPRSEARRVGKACSSLW